MSKLLSSLAFTILLMLSLSLVSAEFNKTVVNGVVYNSDYSQVSGATVTITCNGVSLSGNLTDSHGSYARVFNDAQLCGIGDLMSGEAQLGDKVAVQPSFEILCGDNSGCTGASCTTNSECKDDSIVVLLNFVFGAPVQPSATVVGGGGGGGGGSRSVVSLNPTNSTPNVTYEKIDLGTPLAESNPPQAESNPGPLSRITGAVIGTLGNVGTGVVFIVLFVLIGSFIALKIVRKRAIAPNKE